VADWILEQDALKFWDAPETKIFPLPVVAYALGVGRNMMNKIPVARLSIEGRLYYEKAKILDWALTEDGKNLLHELRGKNTSVSRAAKNRSEDADVYYGKTGPDERGKNGRALQIRRLRKELGEYEIFFFLNLHEPLEPEKHSRPIEAFNELRKLLRKDPRRYENRPWWLIENPLEQEAARKAQIEAMELQMDELERRGFLK
jgi:hypothetical protein